jgi:signal transduction histidine kinase
MTLRLVALMAIVLLLSLMAVGLLVNYYQEQFMSEVQTTAAHVGRAALRTLQWNPNAPIEIHSPAGDSAPGSEPSAIGTFSHTYSTGVAANGAPLTVELTPFPAEPSSLKHLVTSSSKGGDVTIHEQLIYADGSWPATLPGERLQRRLQQCLAHPPPSNEFERMIIDVDGVHAISDPTLGLVLKMTQFTPTEMEMVDLPLEAGQDAADLPLREKLDSGLVFASRNEIALPIRGNYGELFGKLRRRSLALFLGVFLVGIALSTGLATRFTRPIRKLDAGIRRLTDGDLDVEVVATGKDEIGRLSRAFNEMAGKLRRNRDREREMVRRERLSALGRLAAGVAHDVRNPLHSIGLTLQHLDDAARPERPEAREEFARALDIIRGEIKRLDGLVGNFLRFAKSERSLRQRVDPPVLFQELVRLLEKEGERRNVKIDLDIAEPAPIVDADTESLRSTILNLVLNSFEAMPGGGMVKLTSAMVEGEWMVEVADSGEGIPGEELEHVFDFAYSTKEGGHGLGLAMVHHTVVEEHGGRVTLDSTPGKGTIVRLYFPTEGADA